MLADGAWDSGAAAAVKAEDVEVGAEAGVGAATEAGSGVLALMAGERGAARGDLGCEAAAEEEAGGKGEGDRGRVIAEAAVAVRDGEVDCMS